MRVLPLLLCGFAPAFAAEQSTAGRLGEAARVLHEMASGTSAGLLERASCAVIVPGARAEKAAASGRGFATCRKGAAGWSAPTAVRLEAPGAEMGAPETDVVILVTGDGAILMLARGRLAPDVVLAWSRARGVLSNFAPDGVALRSDRSANRELYGKAAGTREVLEARYPSPRAATPLLAELTRFPDRSTGATADRRTAGNTAASKPAAPR